MSDEIENNPKWWEGFDIETAVKECKKLNDENWTLTQKVAGLENYIQFRGLKEEFDRWTKE